MTYHRYFAALLCCILVIAPCLFITDVAEGADLESSEDVPTWGGPTDLSELEAFIDERVSTLSSMYYVMGTTVSVVKDGEMIFSKGYGYKDAAQQEVVSANDTLFRIGSVSKLFTWTAVMQLVEQGKIDLDTDVNAYLKSFRLADAYGGPVTLRHLMTHTAGFEETNRGIVSGNDQSTSIGEFLRLTMPKNINAPGQWVSYSNHGVTLTALMIEDVSGISFQDYVKMNILGPLGMHNTTLEQPPAAELLERLSRGFMFTGEGHEEGDFEYLGTVGAGEVSSTAEDMARFMLMHLNNGTYNGVTILKEETARYMRSEQFRAAPEAAAFLLGFYEMNWRDNVTICGHGGDTQLFHSMLTLFPEYGLGLFVSTNTNTGSYLANHLPYDFVNHYFPVEERVLPGPGPDAVKRADEVAGIYLDHRTAHTGVEKYLLKPSEWVIESTGDGYLAVNTGSRTYKAVEVSPYRYAFMDHPFPEFGDMIFVLDANGRPSHMVFSGIPVASTYERLGVMQQQDFVASLLIASEILLASSFLWAGIALYRWRKGGRIAAPQVALMAAAAIALVFVFLVQNGMDLEAQAIAWEMTLQNPEPITTYLLLPLLVIFLAIAAVVLSMVTVWSKKPWSWWEKVHSLAVFAGLVGFIYWAHFWGLV